MSKHTFETERLLIRPISQQDQAIYCELYTNEKTMRNICPPLSTNDAESAFHRVVELMSKESSHYMNWTIVTKNQKSAIGIMAIVWQTQKQRETNIPEMGIMLTQIAHGKQYPAEAKGGLIEYAFKHMNLDKLLAQYNKKNIAVRRFVKTLGFKLDESSQPQDISQRQDYIIKSNWQKNFITKIL